MKNNMHYISLYFFKKINLLMNERIETLNDLMDNIKKDYSENKKDSVENMGVLMTASTYLTKVSNKRMRENKNEVTEVLNDILIKISKIKNQIIMINECMKLSDEILFKIIYCYIIKNESKMLNNFCNTYSYTYINEDEKKQKVYKELNLILTGKSYNYKKISSIFIEYVYKYNFIFDFFNENKETIRILLEEKVEVNVLSSYIACTNQNFRIFRDKIKKEKVRNISYKDVFVNIVEEIILWTTTP